MSDELKTGRSWFRLAIVVRQGRGRFYSFLVKQRSAMGSTQFLLPRREGLAQLAVKCAYMIGNDGTPWESRVTCAGNRLTVTRAARESGRLITPWTVPGFGSKALSTATLIPRDLPYHLALELCRGTLSRIHSQIDVHQLDEPNVKASLRSAQEHFIQAALQQQDVSHCDEKPRRPSPSAWISSINASATPPGRRRLRPIFSSRLTGFQLKGQRELAVLERVTHWPGNSVFYQGSWREAEGNPGEWDWQSWQAGLERAKKARRRVVCGPLFRLERKDLPDWLYLWDDDFDALQSYVVTYIRAAAERLKRHVNVWYVTSGTNVDTELHLFEEQRLRLTLAALESLRQADSQTPAVVGVKQPWGEYLGRSTADLSPLQFADIIVRSGLGVSGFALEMNWACDTGRTLPRDLLELDRLLEQWSQFGLPLVIILSMPTPAKWDDSSFPLRRELQDILGLLQQKPAVQGIVWNELLDQPDWSAGLVTEQGETKALWRLLRDAWNRSDDE